MKKKFIVIFGAGAVGKMTVGQALKKITNFKLFHNHMMIEPVIEIFDQFNRDVIKDLRDVIFRAFVKSNEYGLIFTFMWALDHPDDWSYIDLLVTFFKEASTDVYFVELVADQQTRLERNKHENRLKHKASKRNLKMSEQRLLDYDEKYRFVSLEEEFKYPNYLKIDNAHRLPEDVAQEIKEKFNL